MKKILLLAGICSLMIAGRVNAQVHVSVNIGSQPTWGPVGYDYVQYYYLPDIDAYYDVTNRQYVYLNGGRWVFARTLPATYHYDVYNSYKVVVNDPKPWEHPDVYRTKYAQYKGWKGERQQIIRDSKDAKYRANNHPVRHVTRKKPVPHNSPKGNDHHDDHRDDHHDDHHR
jgi:hypothetical protein